MQGDSGPVIFSKLAERSAFDDGVAHATPEGYEFSNMIAIDSTDADD